MFIGDKDFEKFVSYCHGYDTFILEVQGYYNDLMKRYRNPDNIFYQDPLVKETLAMYLGWIIKARELKCQQ